MSKKPVVVAPDTPMFTNVTPGFDLGIDPKLVPEPKKSWFDKLLDALAKLVA